MIKVRTLYINVQYKSARVFFSTNLFTHYNCIKWSIRGIKRCQRSVAMVLNHLNSNDQMINTGEKPSSNGTGSTICSRSHSNDNSYLK